MPAGYRISKRRFGSRPAALVALGGALIAILVLLRLPGHGGPTATARVHGLVAPSPVASAAIPTGIRRLPLVSVSPAPGRGIRVPRSFLGLSTEYWTLPIYARQPKLLERVLGLLHVPGDGPMILRIGGDSADRVLWLSHPRDPADWQFAVDRGWLRSTTQVVRAEHLRVILDLNLVTGTAREAALWARAAYRGLPRHSILGFEVGNEPDLYDRALWLEELARQAGRGELPAELTALAYTRDFAAYARSVERIVPRIALIGPEIANPLVDSSWIDTLIDSRPRGLRLITAHRYPLSACVPREDRAFPTIARVLSAAASEGVADSISRAVRLARAAHLPFRLTELNSVTCGGRLGVSNAFATALWAPDTLFALLRAGVTGVNVHVREYASNAAFTILGGGIDPHPLLYGLILFRRALGPGARLARLRVQEPAGFEVRAWAVRLGDGAERVVLIDKGPRTVAVRLKLPGHGPVFGQRLLAPHASSTTGVTLAGQQLGADGGWRGHRTFERVAGARGVYWLRLARYSAALLSRG